MEAIAIPESLKKSCSNESAVVSAKDWSMDYLGHLEAFFKDWLTDSCLGTILKGQRDLENSQFKSNPDHTRPEENWYVTFDRNTFVALKSNVHI